MASVLGNMVFIPQLVYTYIFILILHVGKLSLNNSIPGISFIYNVCKIKYLVPALHHSPPASLIVDWLQAMSLTWPFYKVDIVL